MLPEPPVVCLVSCKTCAVDAGLLPGTQANDLSMLSVADRVGLGVFERDSCNSEVNDGRLGNGGVRGGDDLGEALGGDLDIIAALRK